MPERSATSAKKPARGTRKPRPPDPDAIEKVILDLVHQRGAGKTICPSEAARRLDAEHWRRLMPPVRDVAARMARAGQIQIRRKGKVIDPDTMRGVIRLGLPF